MSRPVRDERGLLDRILSTPDVALVIPHLQPEVLHRVIQSCGLEDCSELVAMATPEQLQRVFDLDLWRASEPGLDERFDADRFGIWLDVLMESGAAIAAEKVAAMDADLVTAALAQHLRVFDVASVSSYESLDGDVIEQRHRHIEADCEIGGYLIEARRTGSWDSIVSLLLALDADHPDYFHRMMSECRRLSHDGFELDGLNDLLDDRAQDMFELAVDRDQRRETQGYLAPAEARAFLESARRLHISNAPSPPANPLAHAYFRAMKPVAPPEGNVNDPADLLPAASAAEAESPEISERVAAIVDALRDARVLTPQPRALLGPSEDEKTPRLTRIEAYLQAALDLSPVVYARRTEELAYLANALVAGCSMQARRIGEREASDAVLAVCNLGLEHWPSHWLVEPDLVSVFQVGWVVLYNDVCMFATERLIGALTELRCTDRETQSGLDDLRIALTKQWRAGTPWRASDSLDVLAILDMPAWTGILGLIDELPVLRAAISATDGSGLRSVSASAFTFISERSRIASIHEFMRTLPDVLRG